MADSTETIRRELVGAINACPDERVGLEERHGRVWNTEEMVADFEAIGFAAPFIVVRRRVDGINGSLLFQHNPRFYWGFQESSK